MMRQSRVVGVSSVVGWWRTVGTSCIGGGFDRGVGGVFGGAGDHVVAECAECFAESV